MNEQIIVYKMDYEDSDLPSMYIGMKPSELINGLDAMLDGADVGTIVTIEIVEVDKVWFDELEPWEA